MTSTKLILFSLLLALLSASSSALANNLCDERLSARLDSTDLNHEMADKYPSLAFFIRDPGAFIKEMRRRFDIQKEKTPDTPYKFDYSEIGIPVFKFAKESLEKKIAEMDARLIEISEGRDRRLWGKVIYAREKLELITAKKYYQDLQTECEAVLSRGNVAYDQTIEYAFFLSRALGHFDARKMPLLTQIMLSIDNRLQGYKQLPIDREYALYRERKFMFFQMSSTVRTFKAVEQSFAKAFSNPHFLERIVVPINDVIDRDILYALVPSSIDLEGLTYDPIAADGFLRPSGHFMNHDRRHNSVKTVERLRYIQSKNPTIAQMRLIMELQDKWDLELQQAIAKIQDPDLREAVDLTAFNWHHDRGYPYTPSVWLETKKNAVIYALDFTLILSGQGTRFKNVMKNTKSANAWLDDFWVERLPDEVAVFQP